MVIVIKYRQYVYTCRSCVEALNLCTFFIRVVAQMEGCAF